MKNKIIIFLAIFSLLMIPTRAVAAAGEIQPFDPGTGNYGYLPFTGFDAPLIRMNFSILVAFSGPSPVRSDVPLPLPPPPSGRCDSFLTIPPISLVATKDSPTNPVVVGQDPNQGGVNLTWTLNILPTIYTYGLWEKLAYPDNGNCKQNGECLINNSGRECCSGYCDPRSKPTPSGNRLCGDNPNNPPKWDCVDYTITYREDIVTLEPKAILTTASRNWIEGDLRRVYPGSHLIWPDWGFRATESCIWEENICVWIHTESHVQVADPGWYDLIVTGTTAGTDITPPRGFSLTGGQFGVYLVESSISGQP